MGEMPMDPNEQDDGLWEVLGQARPPRVSPFFARNVLREVRALPAPSTPSRAWWRWAIPATAAIALGLAGVLMPSGDDSAPSRISAAAASSGTDLAAETELPLETIQSNPDYEVIAELDTLLDFDKNDTWLDSYAAN